MYKDIREKYGKINRGRFSFCTIKFKKATQKEIEWAHQIPLPYTSHIEKLQCLFYFDGDLSKVKKCPECSSVLSYQGQKKGKIFCSKKCSDSSSERKEKILSTKKERYGDPNYNNSNKARETSIERYGKDNYSKTEDYLKKCKATNMEKFGEEWVSQTQDWREKIVITSQEKYGKTHPMKEGKNEIWMPNPEKWFKETQLSLEEICEKSGYSRVRVLQIMKENGIDKEKSAYEKDLCNFIKDLPGRSTMIMNTRPNWMLGKELDIYLKEKKLAIEFNGIYWHTDTMGKTKSYHKKKTEWCEREGIQLLHVFENEWRDPIKKDIWKSVIKAKLGIFDKKYFARNLSFSKIEEHKEKKEARDFLNNNHLQGSCGFSFAFVLKDGNEIVQIMTFGKNRYSRKGEYELLRMATKKNSCVVGGFQKILKKVDFSFVSYGNRRWCSSIKNVYERNGMKISNISDPCPWYTKNWKDLEHRTKYQKHKLDKILENFDPDISADQNMKMNGYHRIWDCGNLVYVFDPHK